MIATAWWDQQTFGWPETVNIAVTVGAARGVPITLHVEARNAATQELLGARAEMFPAGATMGHVRAVVWSMIEAALRHAAEPFG